MTQNRGPGGQKQQTYENVHPNLAIVRTQRSGMQVYHGLSYCNCKAKDVISLHEVRAVFN